MKRQQTSGFTVLHLLMTLGAVSLFSAFFFPRLVSLARPTKSRIATQSYDSHQAGTNSVTSPRPNEGKLILKDIRVGKGTVAQAGQSVTVHYRGRLTTGWQFDASYDRGKPFTFNLGAGEVMEGWDLGVVGMKVGGKRKLTIPSHLGYGAMGSPPQILPDATLIFEIELLRVE
jgi:FKBP-type peptidyl-prolyl cis-trans isomerase